MTKVCPKCGNTVYVPEGQTKVCSCGEIISNYENH